MILSHFGRKAPNLAFLAILLGSVAGLANAALIPTLLAVIAPPASELIPVQAMPYTLLGVEIAHHRSAALFAGLCFVIWLCRTLSQNLLMRVSVDVSREMRLDLYKTVSHASIFHLEQVGLERISNALNIDIARIVVGARLAPDLVVNGITIVGVLCFLAYLSSSVFWFALMVMIVGGALYRLPVWYANRYFVEVRKHADSRAAGVHALVLGAKELKLNRRKRDHFFEEALERNEVVSGQLEIKGAAIVRAAVSYGDLIGLAAVGAIAFIVVNYRAVGQDALIGVVMALMYLAGPVAWILNAMPMLVQASNSTRSIQALCADLPIEDIGTEHHPVANWQKITFSGVTYSHTAHHDQRRFRVGPLDLELKRGQVTFIVGGNGSGKSTIAKLITLHYRPDSGVISFDDVRVGPGQIASYREQIASIYSDYHLFERLFGVADSEMEKISFYLEQLELQYNVNIEDGRFSTLRLSDGQRRRLALLAAFLEDRSVYLFDEWAADQDPEFKRFFYEYLLPQLRQREKCVVVISHDDRYFDVADQLLLIENGRICRKP